MVSVGLEVAPLVRRDDGLLTVTGEPLPNRVGDEGPSVRREAGGDGSVNSVDNGFIESGGHGNAHLVSVVPAVHETYTE